MTLQLTCQKIKESHEFNVFSYGIECYPKINYDEFFDSLRNNTEYKYKCEWEDTLLDSEDVYLPYKNVFVEKNRVILNGNDKGTNIFFEFFFDTLKQTYSPLYFKKAWNECGDTLWDTTSRHVVFNACPKIAICMSIDKQDWMLKLVNDTLLIKYQHDSNRYFIVSIPVKRMRFAAKSFFVHGIPSCGKKPKLNGGLGFLDTILVKDDYFGGKGLTVYIQRNHKKSFYDRINCNYPDTSRDEPYCDAVRSMSKMKFVKNKIESLPTKWVCVVPYMNDIFITTRYLEDSYLLSDSTFTELIFFPKIIAYRMACNNSKHLMALISDTNDTTGCILNLDSLNFNSKFPLKETGKILIPYSSIDKFDILVQQSNCENREFLELDSIDINDAIKVLKKKNVSHVFFIN